MKGLTLERNPIYVRSVANPSLYLSTFKYIWEVTLEKNLLYASCVGKPSMNQVTFKYIQEVTLEKNPFYVSCVAKPSLSPVTFRNIQEVTLERNLTCVSNVGKPSLHPVTLKYIQEFTRRGWCHPWPVCTQCLQMKRRWQGTWAYCRGGTAPSARFAGSQGPGEQGCAFQGERREEEGGGGVASAPRIGEVSLRSPVLRVTVKMRHVLV
jgi:hypothetical protein